MIAMTNQRHAIAASDYMFVVVRSGNCSGYRWYCKFVIRAGLSVERGNCTAVLVQRSVFIIYFAYTYAHAARW